MSDNFAAKTVALADVLKILPQSKDRNQALEFANGMMQDANNELFQRFTVPFLNDLALRMMTGQKTTESTSMHAQPKASVTPNNVEKQDLPPFSSLQEVMPLLMGMSAQGSVVPKPETILPISQHDQFEQKPPVFHSSAWKQQRPIKAELSMDSGKALSSSSFESVKSFFSSHSITPGSSSNG